MPSRQPARSTAERGRGARLRRTARVAAVSAAAAVAGALLLAPAAGAFKFDATLYSYRTLPTSTPEKVRMVSKKSTAVPGKVFISAKRNTVNWQAGPTILDENARIVWYKPFQDGGWAFNVRPQTYDGRPVVTWWQGKSLRGYGEGQGEIYDTAYRHVATVKAGNGRKMDFHELTITPQNTALILAYQEQHDDLTKAPGGGPKKGLILNNYVQEVDIKTGKVLMEWNAGKDVPYSDSYNTVPQAREISYDWMHLNAVNLTKDGNIVVSSRGTHAYYKINRKTGKVMWTMGGRSSDFKMGKGSRTVFQHDVHQLSKSYWSVYDNNGDRPPPAGSPKIHSRGVILKVDEKKMTVDLVQEFVHPKKILAISQGNMQSLASRHKFIGWGGDVQYMTEFDSKGKVVWDAALVSPGTDSFRAYKSPWVGTPANDPLLDAQSEADGKVSIAASWNGSTETAKWRVLAGTTDADLQELGTFPWTGLETTETFATTATRFKVEALDRAGKVLRTSAVESVHAAPAAIPAD